MEIAAVGFPEVLVGYKLAGIRITAECDSQNADSKLNALMDDEKVGLVILDEDLIPFLALKTKKRLEASTKPIVISIPGKSGKTQAGGESISAMVKRAIGVDLAEK
ncbi:MAG: V-type ATP synthase subunit F [Candidatus Norongarragalinales archaeon]